MQRLALPATLLIVALGVLVMAQFLGGPFRSTAAGDHVAAAFSPSAARAQGAERIDARSGLVDYNRLDRRLRALMEDPAMVGLAVAVVENGEITFLRGYGETAQGSGEPVTEDTAFRWASLSKGVAATMVALLADDGAFELSAPVSRLSPSLRLPAAGQMRASVADLLAHRLGIERHTYDARLEADESPHALRYAMASARVACAPGDCHRYQNIAFDAATEIVEGVTGESFEAALSRRLFRPLGLRSASASLRGLEESASWARAHNRAGAEIPVLEPYYRIPSAGGINGSIRDLALWMRAQMGGEPRVIPPRVLAVIHRPVVRTEREDRRNRRWSERITNTRYALGWRVYDYAGHEVVAHRGAVSGYRAMIMFDPARRSGVAVLWNSDSGRPFGIAMDVFDRFYRLPDADWTGTTAGPDAQTVATNASAPGAEMIDGRRRPGDSHDLASAP